MTVRAPLSVVVTWFVLWGACFPVGAVVGAQGGRAGQFLDVKGAVRLQRQTRELPVYLLTAAEVGDVVRVPADGYAELVLDLGGRRLQLLGGSVCRVEAAGVATLNGGAPTEKRRLAAATRLPRRGRGIAGQAFRSGVLIDENAPPTPCGGIRTAPVVLAWAGLEGALQGAQSLELQIREPGPEGKLLRCERLPGTAREFRAPADLCVPGQEYVWELSRPGTDGQPASLGVWPFRLLLPEERAGLAELEQELGASAELPDLLALAVAYDRLDLFAEAEKKYAAARKLAPQDPELERARRRTGRARFGRPSLETR